MTARKGVHWEHEEKTRVYEIYKTNQAVTRYEVKVDGRFCTYASTRWGARRAVKKHQNRDNRVLVERITG